MTPHSTRRLFLGAAAFATASSATRGPSKTAGKPAILGGNAVRREPFPQWPVVEDNDEAALLETLRSKIWYRRRGHHVSDFESSWKKKLGAQHCLATSSGTAALITALAALDVGPKDEVIVPPYTFIATVNAVLMHHAMPVFVDSDPETFQIDAGKIEAAITPGTRCILPVHIGGSAADMDQILAMGKRHGIPVLEDACQAHLGEWRGRKLSTLGDLGCFSFQASKNLNCGEGGALITNDPKLHARADAFHNNSSGLAESSKSFKDDPGMRVGSCNLRMTEFQGALLLSQMERIETQARLRTANAKRLTALLHEIPGISPAKMYEGCTRNAYHLYMFRYDKTQFQGLARSRFLAALKAEGVPCSGGYRPLNKDPFLRNTFATRSFRAIYSKQEIEQWEERNSCPRNDQLCDEGVWLSQAMLLGSPADTGQIAAAVAKIHQHSEALRQA